MNYKEKVRRYNLYWATSDPTTPGQKESASLGCNCPAILVVNGEILELDNGMCPIHGYDVYMELKTEDRIWRGKELGKDL